MKDFIHPMSGSYQIKKQSMKLLYSVLCFGEEETSVDNSAPGKNLLNNEHWRIWREADYNEGNGGEDNSSHDPMLLHDIIKLCLLLLF